MSEIPHINNAFLLLQNKKIQAFGGMHDCPESADEIIDASGKMVLPCWCDSHTHLVFAASREEEFVMRIKGHSYEEIAAAGGGILNSARKLALMSEAELYDRAWERLEEIKNYGTGAVEIKSGYGLNTEAELKMLRVIRKLKENSALCIKATFLGAHAVPAEYKNNRQAYIDLLIDTMLPAIAAEGLADFCDVFCEQNYFSPEDTSRILKAAWKYELPGKIHVNQFTNSGGIAVAIENKALSVDHLEHLNDAEIEQLKNSETIPVALPSCSFFINIPYAPARKIIDSGLTLALASDYNPGSTPSGKIPFVLSLACSQMKMTPEEAINAVTINGAAAMDISDTYGSITVDKRAAVILTKKINSLAYLPYAFGSDMIERVIIQ